MSTEPELREYVLHVGQAFSCDYIVQASSPEAAWAELIDPNGTAYCVEQYPEEITSTPMTSGFRVRNADGDLEDVDL